MKKTKANQVTPVDIRKIRQTVELSTAEMGTDIAILNQGLGYTPIPNTRICEWENGWRHIPDYVFQASTNILLGTWSVDRHQTPVDRQREVDLYYSRALNQPLAELFRLERDLETSRHSKLRKLAKRVRKVRIDQMKFLEQLLDVEMAYVFDPSPEGAQELDVVG